MIIFDNDDEEYMRWIKTYPDGFVINAEKRRCGEVPSMLHIAGCSHIASEGLRYTSAGYKKICSLDKQELIDWWQRCSPGAQYQTCSDCNP